MLFKPIFIAFSCCALLSIGAKAQSADQPGGNLSASDQQFLQMAAQMDMTAAHLGQLAQQQASRQDVKDYGQMLAQSHTNDYQELSSIADQNGATIPKGIDAQHQTAINRLKNLSGPNFDKQFLQQEIQMHRTAIGQYKQEASQGQNPALKAYASKALPSLEDRLNKAQELAGGKPMSSTSPATSDRSQADTRTQADTGAGTEAKKTVTHGTVTKYDPGKTLEVKSRGREGKHVYDLNTTPANIPSDISAGSLVIITESVDENGRPTLVVETDTAPADTTQQPQP